MKKRTRKSWKTSTGVQLSLFAWEPSSPSQKVRKAKNGGANHRGRPSEYEDPFTQARGRIPLYGSASTDYSD